MGRKVQARLTLAVLAVLVLGCGGGSDGGDDGFQFQAGDEDHWAEVWCQIDGSMTRDDVISLMGEPTSEYEASPGTTPQSQWEAGTFHYTVFYDSQGRAIEASYVPADIQSESGPFDCPIERHF